MTIGPFWTFKGQSRRKLKMLLVTGYSMDNWHVFLCFRITTDRVVQT